MCLAVPAKLVTCEGSNAVADLHGSRVEVSTLLVPGVKQGDWVLIHAGFAIQKLEEDEAKETFALLADMQAAENGRRPAANEGKKQKPKGQRRKGGLK
jgi:hydrogenase expression/formation protein HypC